MSNAVLRVGIAGLGAIGSAVAQKLVSNALPGCCLVAASARNRVQGLAVLDRIGADCPLVNLSELVESADVIVECLPPELFFSIAEPTLARGRTLISLSVGALLENLDLLDRFEGTGARVLVPTGAILGLDVIRAAAEGTIHSVRIITRKPPAGLVGAPFIEANAIALPTEGSAVKIFSGTVRESIRAFPKNVNVAAAVSLAGIGPERTMIEVWVDPKIDRNMHRVELDSDIACCVMEIESLPSPQNPRTSGITPLSVIALLKRLTATMVVGS